MKEEKYTKINDSHKRIIFMKNFGEKIKNIEKSNQLNNNGKKYILIKPKNLPLDKYLEQLKEYYFDEPIFFESMNITNNKYHYLFSFCPFCQNLVVACDDKVICTNGCYNLGVRTDEFNDKYTLDKFLESYYLYTSDHIQCNGEIIPIYVDNEEEYVFFICSDCDKKIINKFGIVL